MILLLFSIVGAFLQFSEGQVPTANAHMSQTGYGYFRLVGFNNRELLRLSSVWLQDDENKRLKVTTGEIGEPGWMANYWFFSDRTYEINPTENGGIECTMFDDFTYDEEVGNYDSRFLSYVGRSQLMDHRGAMVNVFAGQALDGVGPLNTMMYIGAETGTYNGLVVIGAIGKFAFNEYWLGDNSTLGAPPAHQFTIHPSCASPKLLHYRDRFNKTTGERLDKPTANEGLTGDWKSTCGCSQNVNVAMMQKPSLFMYSTFCCPLLSSVKSSP